ncbi:DUF2639 domain-containing protein [Bacillus sp. Marseille-P3661]|nr:DUF2639 domain-containing protein [Bacillus sp. Marseille-P3661]
MVHFGSKGYYVKLLKDQNIRLIDGKRLESYKTHYLANYYFSIINEKNK